MNDSFSNRAVSEQVPLEGAQSAVDGGCTPVTDDLPQATMEPWKQGRGTEERGKESGRVMDQSTRMLEWTRQSRERREKKKKCDKSGMWRWVRIPRTHTLA